MAKINLKNEDFDSVVREGAVLVDFFAPWCGPCRAMMPIIDEIASEREDIKVVAVNVDEQRALAERFRVVSIPTLLIMKDGETVTRLQGARPKAALLEIIDDAVGA
ncbi:MAG: thioredoxin [Clostridia bacterium]|nr:thioredoxin [Clostridia bacterium]MBQ8289636.1 thioredoxin [Clostridia bacterium]